MLHLQTGETQVVLQVRLCSQHFLAIPCFNSSFVISGTFLPLMVNPHKLLDYDTWWNKALNNIKPYTIPALSSDIVAKLHNQLDASSDRIWRTRSAEEASKIIDLLRELINSHTEERTFKFSWKLSLYKNPPKKKTMYTSELMLLCRIYFKLLSICNTIFGFTTNRLESILQKRLQ